MSQSKRERIKGRFVAKSLDLDAVKEFALAHSQSETAEHFEVSYITLYRRGISEYKQRVKKERPPSTRKGGQQPLAQEKIDAARELLECGFSMRKVARWLETTTPTLRRHDLKSSHPPGWPTHPKINTKPEI